MNDIDDKTPLMSDRLQRFLWHRLFEIGGLAIFVAGLLLAAILISANSQDPSFNTASGQEVHNLLGPLGAEFATLLYDGFGIIAGLLSLILLVWGLRIMMQKHLKRWRLRLLGLLVSLLCLSAGAHGLLAPIQATADGGMTGRLIFEAIIPLAGQISWPEWVPLRVLIASLFTLFGTGIYIWSSAVSYRHIARSVGLARHLRRLIPALPKPALSRADTPVTAAEKPKKKKRKSATARKEPVILDTGLAEEMADTGEGKTAASKPRAQTAFDFQGDGRFKLPPLKLLKTPPKAGSGPDNDELNDNASRLKQVLEDFRIQGEIDEVRYGPVVTRYGLNPCLLYTSPSPRDRG